MLEFVGKQETAFLSSILPLCLIVVSLSVTVSTSESCATIKMSNMTLKKLSVIGEEHSLVTLPFRLDTSHCPRRQSQNVHVYVTRPSTGEDLCVIGMTRERCTSTNEDLCRCVVGEGYMGAVFTKTLAMEDRGTWLWRTGGEERKEVEFIIQPSSKPRISNVSVLPVKTENATEQTPDDERTVASSTEELSEGTMDEDNSLLALVFSCVSVVIIICIVVVVVCVVRRRKLQAKRPQADYGPDLAW
ncbi:uncharacterized protein [Littorina saxatilis]|uniref:uncharacterized protein n=1 Tax=Littorina saxatilis TaxID=31220 RepID=UPI0038B57D57